MDPDQADASSRPAGKSADPAAALAAGQVVGSGRFALKLPLGQGGMGVVWMAQDLRLNDFVALKFLPPEIRNDPAALDDMRRETFKSRKLSHPNIIRIHDLSEAPGEAPFILMEYVDGETLTVMRLHQPDRVFPWEFLAPLIRQLCEALEYAHGERVIHRDLKPANMMLDSKGRLKLADFGIAATISDSISRVSLRQPTSGTMTHMSPQQMDGETPRITDDIYALGATIYELLTGRPPFYTGDIVHQVHSLPAKPMEERLAESAIQNPIPTAVSAMVMACLAKDPAQRPPSARAVAEWIGLNLPGTDTGGLGAHLARPTTSESGAVPRASRNKLAIAGALATALALIGSAAWHFGFHKRTGLEEVEETTVSSETSTTNSPVTAGTNAAQKIASKAVPGSPGSVDRSFDTQAIGFQGVGALAIQSDGKAIVSGNDPEGLNLKQPHPGTIFRLEIDGTRDPTFTPAHADREVFQMLVQPDGRVLLCGGFRAVNRLQHTRLARLNADGTLDTAFTADFDKGNVFAIALQPDGCVLVGGSFNSIARRPQNRLVRLRPNGALDPSFKSVIKADHSIRTILVQPDGRIIVGGWFIAKAGQKQKGLLVRLRMDGSIDPTFKPIVGLDPSILNLALQPDSKIIVGGNFTSFTGKSRNHILRLNPDGVLDSTFDPGAGASGVVKSLLLQPDGKVVIAAGFNFVRGIERKHIARLNPDGGLDQKFDPAGGPNGGIAAVALQRDGKLLVGGEFTSFDGVPCYGVVRLHGAGAKATPANGPAASAK